MSCFIEIKFENIEKIQMLKILQTRSPHSNHIYNIVKFNYRFPLQLKIFTLGNKLDANTWILTIFERQDYGQDVNISRPQDSNNFEEFRIALINFEMLNWTAFRLTAIDLKTFEICLDVSKIKKQNVQINTCLFYQMDISEANDIRIDMKAEGFEFKRLEGDVAAHFLSSNWAFTKEGTFEFCQTLVKNNESIGLYEKGELVCAAVQTNNGIGGFLFTNEKYRNRGFGLVVSQALMNQIGANGYYPVSVVDVTNEASKKLHAKIGLHKSHVCYFITRKPTQDIISKL